MLRLAALPATFRNMRPKLVCSSLWVLGGTVAAMPGLQLAGLGQPVDRLAAFAHPIENHLCPVDKTRMTKHFQAGKKGGNQLVYFAPVKPPINGAKHPRCLCG